MPRLHLDLPERFTFSTEVTVYIGHINSGEHLDNARLLGLVAEARARFFASLGFREDDIEGFGSTVTDVLWIYRAEAFYGDVLVIELTPCDYNKYGFDLVYRMTRKADGVEIGRGKHGMVFLQPGVHKIAQVPEAFARKAGGDTRTRATASSQPE
jgi:4-hydroxybenzoyl-CoA thioesterase